MGSLLSAPRHGCEIKRSLQPLRSFWAYFGEVKKSCSSFSARKFWRGEARRGGFDFFDGRRSFNFGFIFTASPRRFRRGGDSVRVAARGLGEHSRDDGEDEGGLLVPVAELPHPTGEQTGGFVFARQDFLVLARHFFQPDLAAGKPSAE